MWAVGTLGCSKFPCSLAQTRTGAPKAQTDSGRKLQMIGRPHKVLGMGKLKSVALAKAPRAAALGFCSDLIFAFNTTTFVTSGFSRVKCLGNQF